MMRSRQDSDGGFSLLEVLFAMTFLTLAVVSVGMGVQSAALTTREIQEQLAIQNRAQGFVDGILAAPWGGPADEDPTAGLVSEVFDDDVEIGAVTLHQLSRWPAGDDGWRFTLASFPVTGEWRVQVDNDANDDGQVGAVVAEGDPLKPLYDAETEQRVFRIRVFFNERLVLATNRAMEVSL